MAKLMLQNKTAPASPPIPFIPTPPGIPSPAPIPALTVQSPATFPTFVRASKDLGLAPHTASTGVIPILPNLLGGPIQLDYVAPLLLNSIAVSVRKPLNKKVAKLPIGPAPIRAKVPAIPPVPAITLLPPVFPAALNPLLGSFFVNIRK